MAKYVPKYFPRYKLSSLGRLYVADERLKNLPIARIIFLVITSLVGILTLSRFLIVLKHKNVPKLKSTKLLKSTEGRVILLYILSYVIHSLHYVDNIYRPANYFEPKWLYQKYLISEMEITFFANFLITFSGLYFMERLVNGINGGKYRDIANACTHMIWYIFGSLLTLGHYRTEPPWKYEPFVNFTIGGEGLVTILLAIHLYQLRRESNAKISASTEYFDMEQSAGLLDEDQKDSHISFPGIRSRTPIKNQVL